MTSPPPPTRLLAALATGIGTAAYYATPDVVASRRARGWVKTALVAAIAAASVPDVRAVRTAARSQAEQRHEDEAPTSAGTNGRLDPADVLGELTTRGTVVLVGTAVGVLSLSVGTFVVAERWIFRRGQARAAAGRRLPHTGPALLYGALAAGLSLVPPPSVGVDAAVPTPLVDGGATAEPFAAPPA